MGWSSSAQFSLGGKDGVVPGAGLSVEDFVAKVLVAYAIGKIKHQNSRGSLMTVLGTAMRNDIIPDALRKKSHEMEEARATTSANEDSEENHHEKPALDEYPQSLAPDPYSVVDEDEYRARIRTVVDDELPLKDLVEAVLDLELYSRKTSRTLWELALPMFKTERRSCAGGCVRAGWFACPRKKAERYETSYP